MAKARIYYTRDENDDALKPYCLFDAEPVLSDGQWHTHERGQRLLGEFNISKKLTCNLPALGKGQMLIFEQVEDKPKKKGKK